MTEQCKATLHDRAMLWIRNRIKDGLMLHRKDFKGLPYYCIYTKSGGFFEADVLENVHRQKNYRYHEIEIVNLNKRKLQAYIDDKTRVVLWLVVPEKSSAVFESIRLLEENQDGFNEVECWKNKQEHILLYYPRCVPFKQTRRR